MKNILPLLALIFFACTKQDDNSPVVARVGDVELTLAEAKKDLLKNGLTDADLENVVVRWVDREILFRAAIKSGYHKDESLNKAISDYRRFLLGNKYLSGYTQKTVFLSPGEVETYYEKNKSSFVYREDQAVVLHFSVSSKNEANKILSVLKKPGTPEAVNHLLKKYNVEPEAVSKGKTISPLNERIFSKKKREFIGPVQTKLGYHVIQVLSRKRKGTPRDLLDVYDEIQQRLIQSKALLATDRVLDSLRYNYQAEIYLEGK